MRESLLKHHNKSHRQDSLINAKIKGKLGKITVADSKCLPKKHQVITVVALTQSTNSDASPS